MSPRLFFACCLTDKWNVSRPKPPGDKAGGPNFYPRVLPGSAFYFMRSPALAEGYEWDGASGTIYGTDV